MTKNLITGPKNLNLLPIKYPWAWDRVKLSRENRWFPEEIAVGEDKYCYTHTLTPAEQNTVLDVIANLTFMDVQIMDNLQSAVAAVIRAPEVSRYLAHQANEEGVHSEAYVYCIQHLGIDEADIAAKQRGIPALAAKYDFADRMTDNIRRFDGDYVDPLSYGNLLKGLIFYYGVAEAVWFRNGLTPLFALQRQNKMIRTGEQFQYILRDEVQHYSFGVDDLIPAIMQENGRLDTPSVQSIVNQGIELEAAYAHACIRPMVGYNADIHIAQSQYYANVALIKLGYQPLYQAKDVCPWLDEQTGGLRKEKNFFETRVTEYQTSNALRWD
jgi:ribonucleoside-diphosphate reductase beta chain